VFDTLLASNVARHPTARSALAALLLHLAIVTGAITATASSRDASQPPVRDTIRLELAQPRIAERRHSQPVAPRAVPPEIPAPPADPELPPSVPDFEPARLSLAPIDLAALGRRGTGLAFRDSAGGPGPTRSVLSATEVDHLPELQGDLHLRYPAGLERTGVSGVVELEYVISSSGRVEPRSVRVLESPHPAFSAAATDAVSRARFSPARRGGQPVAVLVRQTIRFVSR
jgi:TonB family protein